MPTMTATRTMFSVRPAATVPVQGDAGDLLDAVLTALEQDDRAIGPACGYDYDTGQVSCTFQVILPEWATPDLERAIAETREIFDAALEQAGVDAVTSGVAIVEGDDPDLLP